MAHLVRGMMLLCLLGAVPPTPAADLTVEYMLGSFGFDQDERKAIVDGEIVSRSQAELEGSKKGIAIAVAMIIPHKVKDCVETFAGTELFRVDPELLDFGVIDVTAGRVPEGFARVGFTESEAEETEGLVDFSGGSDFNLSRSEIQTLRSLDGSNRGAINDAYRRMLMTRFESYLRQGLDGVPPYERKNDQAKPGEELGIAMANSPVIEQRVPHFYAHITGFPESSSEHVEDRYYWTKHVVQGRPAISLIHWMLDVDPDHEYAFLAEREFFVGHTYNSMSVYFGVFPFGDDVMVFYLNHTFTDLVAGFGSSLAHKIGRGRMASEVKKRFEAIRVELARADRQRR